MDHDPKRLREIMADAAPPDLELAFRPMFGGIMAYAEGKPFAILLGTKMALKAKGPSRSATRPAPRPANPM